MSSSDAESMDFKIAKSAVDTKPSAAAMPLLTPFAQQGQKIAQRLCGMMYQYGLAGGA